MLVNISDTPGQVAEVPDELTPRPSVLASSRGSTAGEAVACDSQNVSLHQGRRRREVRCETERTRLVNESDSGEKKDRDDVDKLHIVIAGLLWYEGKQRGDLYSSHMIGFNLRAAAGAKPRVLVSRSSSTLMHH